MSFRPQGEIFYEQHYRLQSSDAKRLRFLTVFEMTSLLDIAL